MSAPLLSLCMIVKDEQENLARCLRSVRGVVDEIVVIDTGSEDQSAAVAESLGARVAPFVWTNDFAAARNYSLSFATGEWVLVLDADEELQSADPVAFRRWLETAPRDTYQVELLNLTGDQAEAGMREPITRLFRRDAGLQYQGVIHEQLVPRPDASVRSAGLAGLELAPHLRILHHGYLPEVLRDKGKPDRNRRLLEKALESAPGDPYLNYQLGVTLFQMKEYPAAWSALARALATAPNSPSIVREAGYCLKALGRHDEALELTDAGLRCYRDFTDLAFLRGLIFLEKGEVSEAARALINCLELGEAPPRYRTRVGVGSFLAAYNLGVIFEVCGDARLAAENYRLALSFNPSFRPASDRLAAKKV